MRVVIAAVVLFLAVLIPKVGNAQVYQFRTPLPEVTAASADWQISSVPILVQGLVFYPTRETRMFDGMIMAQIATFDGVPIYADTTLEPYSIIYVPVGRERMRTYERKREGDLAGTTGSRTPSFPVDVATPSSVPPPMPLTALEHTMARSSTISTAVDRPLATAPSRPSPAVETIPRPRVTNGVWLEFEGARWYSDGAATTYTSDRFSQIGEYRGFPVYRDRTGKSDEIWVQVVKDGPVAPYRRR